MKTAFAQVALALALVAAGLVAAACSTTGVQNSRQVQSQSPARGQLLYETHCIECHTTQMHWRSRKLARDWGTLRAQVTRWQAVAKLNWSEQEIDDVTHYLNDTIYQFPPPQGKVVSR